MRDGDVVALQVIVDVHLPIAIDHVIAPLLQLQAGELKPTRLVRNLAKKDGEWLRLQIKIHKNKLFPGFQAQRHHAHRAAIEKLNTVHIRRADQAAVQRISPAMISAAQNVLAAASLRNGARAMTAYIAQGPQRAFLVANNNNRLACNLRGEETFRIGDGALAAILFSADMAQRSRKLPCTPENLRLLNF